MKRVDQLITNIRERTRNVDFSVDSSTGEVESGISDNLVVEFLNDGQDHLQAAILAVYPNEFIEEEVVSLVANQEAYSITRRVFANNKLVSVEARSSSSDSDYVVLRQGTFVQRDTTRGFPDFYIRRSGEILLNPIPSSSSGAARINYYVELDDLDIRRGTITARTIGATQLTALTLDTSDHDALALADADYLCVNDRYGNVTMYNIPITSYASTTGVVTLSPFTFASGESVAVGDYVTIGKFTTTHSKLPDICERYLRLYAQKRLLQTDESSGAVEEDTEVLKCEQDVLNSYADESRDPEDIPILDEEIMI